MNRERDDPARRLGPPADSTNDAVFRTAQLTLDTGLPGDAEQLFPMVHGAGGDPVTRSLYWDGPDSVEPLRAWIAERAAARWSDGGHRWVLRDPDGALSGTAGAALGTAGLRPEPEPGRANLGYWLGEPYWGRGLMTEAIGRLVQHAFGALRLAKLEADVLPGNAANLRLLERLGFQREGLRRRAFVKRGRWVDVVLFGVLPEEFVVPPAALG